MKKIIISVALILALLLIAGAAFVVYVGNQPENSQVVAKKTYTNAELLKRTNEIRKESGVKLLIEDAQLDSTAEAKLNDMVKNNYFGHWNPTTGKSGIDTAFQMGIKCTYASENLAKDFPNNPIDGLMTSPSHKAAILDPRYESVGFGISEDIVVQHFCDIN